ncbi:MAG: phosphatase PAP2 family protein [Selenomonadaceae bacterium]|nr:phosphatase PAP2 family protein [Selenomonadaceae bacterium]
MDLEYLLFLQGLRTDWGGEGFFTLVSKLPSSSLTAMIPALLYWCRDKQAGIFLLFNAQCGRMINDLLKGTFCVYRPWFSDANLAPSAEAMAKASEYSFPSGHTQFTAAIFGGFAFFYRKVLAKPVIAFFALIVLLVAFSRNFLGVHTPQDVLVAIIYSIGLFFVAEKIFAWIGKDDERKLIFFIGGLLAVTVVFLWLYFKPYPEDILNGKVIVNPLTARADAFDALGFGLAFFLGWFLEQKFINFKINVPKKDRLWRIVIGFAVLGVILVVIYPLIKYFLSLEAYKFFKAFLPFFSILFVIPLIFTRVEKRFKK